MASNNPDGRRPEYTNLHLKTQRFPDLGTDKTRRNILRTLDTLCSKTGDSASEVLSTALEGYLEKIEQFEEN